MNDLTTSASLPTIAHVNLREPTRRECKRTLASFAEKLANPIQKKPLMERTGLGTTGFTFLCDNPSAQAGPSERFVLKWQKRAFCINEVFCNTFISLFEFHTPRTLLLNQSALSTQLYQRASKIGVSMPAADRPNETPLEMIFMERVSGTNFASIVHAGKILDLNTEQRLEIFKTLGSIVPFDLMIGNDDRMIRVQKDLDTTLPIERQNPSVFLTPNPSMNYGNVMVDLPSTINPSTILVSFIDSTTNPKMLTPELKMSEEFEENFSANLFGEEDDYITPQLSSNPSNSPQRKMQTDLEKKENLEKIFMRLFAEVFSNPQLFSEHVQDSIYNGMNEIFKSKPGLGKASKDWQKILKVERSKHSEAILSGIQLGCEKLIQNRGRNLQEELQQLFDADKAREMEYPDIILKNLEWLRSDQLNCKET